MIYRPVCFLLIHDAFHRNVNKCHASMHINICRVGCALLMDLLSSSAEKVRARSQAKMRIYRVSTTSKAPLPRMNNYSINGNALIWPVNLCWMWKQNFTQFEIRIVNQISLSLLSVMARNSLGGGVDKGPRQRSSPQPQKTMHTSKIHPHQGLCPFPLKCIPF